MQALVVHTGIVAPLLRANVDTDAIIPSREMRHVSRSGLAQGLFANWRYLDSDKRVPDPAFILNHPDRAGASVLLGGPNFGCGSSREHAVWALAEFGIRVIIAPDFSPIFRKNCVANGLLPACVPLPAIRQLAAWTDEDPQGHRLTIDLETCRIVAGGAPVPFEIPRAPRTRLLRGLDDIAMTRTRAAEIDAFERARFAAQPWLRLSDSSPQISPRRLSKQ